MQLCFEGLTTLQENMQTVIEPCMSMHRAAQIEDGWPAPLTTSSFIPGGQLTSSPGNSTYCNAGLTVSSLAVAVTTTSTDCTYTQKDGQAELGRVAVTVHPKTITPQY